MVVACCSQTGEGVLFMRSRLFARLSAVSLGSIIPWFLIVPILVFILRKLEIATAFGVSLMIVNMLLLSCLLLFRGGLIISGFFRQAPTTPPDIQFVTADCSLDSLRGLLVKLGYRLHRENGYAERGWKSIATAAMLISFGLMLTVGTYDNLFQFRGAVQIGTGDPANLADEQCYSMFNHGPLMSLSRLKYKVKGVERYLPNSQYKYGAAKIRIIANDNTTVWEGILEPFGSRHTHKGIIYAMNSLQYNLSLIVMTTKNHLLFTDWLHLYPLVKPVEGFTHHGKLKTDKFNDFDGTALYNEVTERLQLKLRHKDKHFDIELGVAPDHEKVVGNYKIINQGTARLTQLDVMRARHTSLMLGLAGCSVVAGIISLCTRRQRVWFRGGDIKGCLIAADDPRLGDQIASSKG